MKQKWTPFWLETNSTFGLVDSAEVWVQKRHEWDKDASRYGICPDEIYELKSYDRDSNDKSQTPSFGSRREHIGGKMTLGLFFALHGMDRSIGGA